MSARARLVLAVCAAAAAVLGTDCAAAPAAAPAADPAAAPAAQAVWRPPPPHEGRDAPFVTGGHSSLGYGYGATSGTDANSGAGGRRLIYYAHLPDVGAPAPPRRGRLDSSAPPQRWPPSYAIVDADAQPQADRPRRREFPLPPPLPGARYDRLPAPPPPYYRHRPAPDYYSYPDRPDVDYSARRPDLDYSARRPDLDYSARRPDLDYSARRPDVDYARRPDLEYSARRPDVDYSARRPELAYAGRPEAGGRPVLEPRRPGAVYRGPQAAAPPPEDPYRGYNPRQPAPWSLQVGARLTVRDDGRRLPPGAAGGGGGGAGARRFYVSSQPPGPHYAVPLRYS